MTTLLQDGFFLAELLDGRKGLVPSNFLERLSGDDLLEFHRTVVLCDENEENGETLTVLPSNFSQEDAHSMSEQGIPETCKHHIVKMKTTQNCCIANLTADNEDLHLLNATYLTPEEEERNVRQIVEPEFDEVKETDTNAGKRLLQPCPS